MFHKDLTGLESVAYAVMSNLRRLFTVENTGLLFFTDVLSFFVPIKAVLLLLWGLCNTYFRLSGDEGIFFSPSLLHVVILISGYFNQLLLNQWCLKTLSLSLLWLLSEICCLLAIDSKI